MQYVPYLLVVMGSDTALGDEEQYVVFVITGSDEVLHCQQAQEARWQVVDDKNGRGKLDLNSTN